MKECLRLLGAGEGVCISTSRSRFTPLRADERSPERPLGGGLCVGVQDSESDICITEMRATVVFLLHGEAPSTAALFM